MNKHYHEILLNVLRRPDKSLTCLHTGIPKDHLNIVKITKIVINFTLVLLKLYIRKIQNSIH